MNNKRYPSLRHHRFCNRRRMSLLGSLGQLLGFSVYQLRETFGLPTPPAAATFSAAWFQPEHAFRDALFDRVRGCFLPLRSSKRSFDQKPERFASRCLNATSEN